MLAWLKTTTSAGTITSKRTVLFLWPVNLTLFQTQANWFIGRHRGRFSWGGVFIASFPSLVLKHKTPTHLCTHRHTHSCKGHCPQCHINICRAKKQRYRRAACRAQASHEAEKQQDLSVWMCAVCDRLFLLGHKYTAQSAGAP